jgi:hypothetical protein
MFDIATPDENEAPPVIHCCLLNDVELRLVPARGGAAKTLAPVAANKP